MNEDSTVVRLRQPEEIDDPLTAVLRSGARRLLAQAIEAEAAAFLALMADRRCAEDLSAMGGCGSFGTVTVLLGRSRLGSGRSRCSG